MSPHHPTEVLPAVLDLSWAACVNSCEFQEVSWGFPAFPGCSGCWPEASHSTRCSLGTSSPNGKQREHTIPLGLGSNPNI